MDDERAIVRVLHEYCAGIDRLDAELLRGCFTPDADCDYGAGGHWRSADEIVAYMMPRHKDNYGPTQHRLTNCMVDVNGDRAKARSYVNAILLAKDGKSYRNAVAEYDDQLVRVNDKWRIAKRKTTVHFISTEPVVAA